MNVIANFWKKLGPGLITGASDDDPSGIATYSQAGAAFGLATLWTALVTYPLMFCIQEMCARIGIVTGAGLGHVIKARYPKLLIWVTLIALFPAITFNIAADLAGMGAVAHLLVPFFPIWFYAALFTGLLIWGLIFCSYQKMAFVLKWLSLSLLVYAIVPFLVKQDWQAVLWAVIFPSFEWSKNFWSLLVAILGTTISPYLFLWQTSMSIEHKNHKEEVPPKKEIKEMKVDVNVGMFWSNLIMFFIILTTGSVLFPAGINHIETVQDAAEALKPLAGNFAYELFALGVIGTGLLAIPVLAGCLGYLFADVFKWEKGIDKKFKEAKGFYSIILTSVVLGLLLNAFNLDPIRSLIYTAIIYGLLAPFLILIILHICNQPKIMANYTNPWWSNLLGILALLLMGGSAFFLIYFL
jgi:NRAMP (natural resistance-associated macrophage protein)-like metal ion transporter